MNGCFVAMIWNTESLDDKDQQLLRAAREVIARNFEDDRHGVGAAVLCGSGAIHVGVNLESCAYGPCAEFTAVGSAVTAGERIFERIVAVRGPDRGHAILPPCGNCRQLLSDYAPDCLVILPGETGPFKVRARDLLPTPYRHFDDDKGSGPKI